jgi:hypothetical protein
VRCPCFQHPTFSNFSSYLSGFLFVKRRVQCLEPTFEISI